MKYLFLSTSLLLSLNLAPSNDIKDTHLKKLPDSGYGIKKKGFFQRVTHFKSYRGDRKKIELETKHTGECYNGQMNKLFSFMLKSMHERIRLWAKGLRRPIYRILVEGKKEPGFYCSFAYFPELAGKDKLNLNQKNLISDYLSRKHFLNTDDFSKLWTKKGLIKFDFNNDKHFIDSKLSKNKKGHFQTFYLRRGNLSVPLYRIKFEKSEYKTEKGLYRFKKTTSLKHAADYNNDGMVDFFLKSRYPDGKHNYLTMLLSKGGSFEVVQLHESTPEDFKFD